MVRRPGPDWWEEQRGQGLTLLLVYGGVIDVLLALFPWFIIRKLLLETREKWGLTLAMSLGAITGTIVIFRAFYQLKEIDNNYRTCPGQLAGSETGVANSRTDFMVFMSIFNFLEPGVTIIAQAIPMFRVLVVNVKRGSNAVRISSPTGAAGDGSGSAPIRSWNSKRLNPREADEELMHVRIGPGGRLVHLAGPEGSDDDLKIYDGRN